MNITQPILLSFVPVEDMRMNFWYAHGIVKKQYCGPMTARGLCTGVCENCKAGLIKAFQLKEARSPSALLTWTLKTAIVEAQEKANTHEPVVLKQNAYGVVQASEDVFAAFLK